uniref:Uncharacterized protein n=1 Tax=Solanum lycopersicum TaxID=4081 RepID=A0A3Q7IHZ7_SOLLC
MSQEHFYPLYLHCGHVSVCRSNLCLNLHLHLWIFQCPSKMLINFFFLLPIFI